MKITNARLYGLDGFEEGTLCVNESGRIAEEATGPAFDAAGLTALPGLLDIHFHGCMGVDFCDGSEQAIQTMADYELQNGVMAICPATMTMDEETLGRVADTARAHQNGRGADLVGINMEGPFISPHKKGAQNGEFIQPPSADLFRRLQQRAGGLFKLCDIAPEMPNAIETIRALRGEAVLSLAHTCADYDTALTALQAGASHMTHLYNAMPGISHRAPGPIVAALEQGAEAELIADGIHVAPAMVRFTFRVFGAEKVILISDSMRAAGLADGEYTLGGQEVTVQGRRATLTGQPDTLAGSVTNLMDCLRSAVGMGVDLHSAVRAASTNPAVCIGVDADYGSLLPGRWANVLLIDDALRIVHAFQKGRQLW